MRKIDEDLVVYTVIEPINSDINKKYKLSALQLLEGGHCMPSFEIHNNDGIQDEDVYWDAESYLKETLYTLRAWKNRKTTERAEEFIKELIQDIPEDDFEDVLLMFEKGFKLGFFEL